MIAFGQLGVNDHHEHVSYTVLFNLSAILLYSCVDGLYIFLGGIIQQVVTSRSVTPVSLFFVLISINGRLS